MANKLMRNVMNYTINQRIILKNILQGNSAEILINRCEQRMKTVKLILNNYMNIRIENMVEDSVFIFPLIESCMYNDVDLHQDYLKVYSLW